MTRSLSGMRILVVEDEPLIAMDVASTIECAGGSVAGPVGSVEAALDALEGGARGAPRIDAVVLDVNLGPRTSDPIALCLGERGIPFVLHTGSCRLPEAGAIAASDAPVVHKPAPPDAIVAALHDAIARTDPA